MDQIKHVAPPVWLTRVAGGLLIAMALVIIYFSLALVPRYGLGWLPFSIGLAVVIGLPPLLTGIGVLRRSATARGIGIAMTLVGAIAFGNLLARDGPGPNTPVWAVMLAADVIVLAMLAAVVAAGFLRDRSKRSCIEDPTAQRR